MVNSVGIDVSKLTCNIALLHEDGEYTETVFNNSAEGIQAFKIYLKRKRVSEETPFVLESTGKYHLLFAMTLVDTHFRGVKVINPILTKKYQKSSVRKIKTDKVDAKMLAQMGIMEKLPTFKCSRTELLKKKRITLLKKLEHIRQQLSANLKELADTTKDLDITQEEAEGSQLILESIQKEIITLKKKIIQSEDTKLALELAKIKGVSKQSAAILSYFFNSKEFQNKNQLVAFTGFDLTVRESGTSVHGRRRLSKRGDPFLRKKIFQIAWGLTMHNSIYTTYYEKKRAEGKHYYSCLCAVSRKFLRHLFFLKKQLS